jgi:uncharacterized protein YciI
MYAVVVRYKVPIAEVEKHVQPHRDWLNLHLAAGHFLLFGRQRGAEGGFLLADEMPRADLDTILAADPYAIEDVATYEVTDVVVRGAQEAFRSLIPTA